MQQDSCHVQKIECLFGLKQAMKLTLLAIAFVAATSAQAASPTQTGGAAGLFASGKSLAAPLSFEAAGRKGSRRVGGTGRSGKGGHYVGGRR